MWDVTVSVPDHCLSFYFSLILLSNNYRIKFRELLSNAV